MKTETINLQGITTSKSKELAALRKKNLDLREMVGLQHGVEVEAGSSLMATLNPQQLRSVESLCVYLEGEEGGAEILDTIFQDARSFEDLSRQLFMVAALMQELDSIGVENDFPGRREARSMLGTLSLQLKKTARIAANARPGRIASFR